MELTRRCQFLVVVLLLVDANVFVHGHDVAGYQELGVVGFLAPFGLASQDTYTEVWGEGDLALLGSLNDGVAIIDVADPTAPMLAGGYHASDLLDVSDVKSQAGIGFFASGNGGGIHIVDYSDPSQPMRVAQLNSRSQQGFDDVSELVVEDGLLFAVSSSSPVVKLFNVSDVSNPTFLREFVTPETIGLSDIQVTRDRLYVAGLGGNDGTGAVYIYDRMEVVDASMLPTELGRISPGSNTGSISVNEDTNRLASTQLELGGELSVWNVEDVSSLNQLDSANVSDFALNSYSTGEVAVDGQIAYIAWYEAGFQVIDLDNLESGGKLQILGGYDTSPFSSPLDGFVGNRSVFPYLGADRVLLSDTEWGLFIVDANPALQLVGDLDGNGQLEANDIDQMTVAIQNGEFLPALDLDGNGELTRDDRTFLITQILGSTFGDANLDGSFDSSDLVRVFIPGKYEDQIPSNATWAEGDWNGDGDFSSGDLIAAFTTGDYENQVATSVVPESNGMGWTVVAGFTLLINIKRRRKR